MGDILRKSLILTAILGLLAVVYLSNTPAFAQEETPLVLVLTADGAVSSTMADYLERGIRSAEKNSAEALVLQLNTPGGEITLMNRMVQTIRNSPVPVIVYVSPRGAMAGSAGTLLTLAGHIAAMAPETTIGAASPVGSQGEDIGETMEAKLKEMLKASVRTLAERRGPLAVELAEETIENARAVSANEALEIGLIDYVAADLQELLLEVDGDQVDLAGGERSLQTANARTEELEYTLVESILMILTNPNIVFLLLTIGVQAILIEISSPGGWLAGFIGIVSLLLAVYGMGFLPVNWFGLLFIGLAFALFLLDLKAPTHGALTAAGVGSFIAGALILFNSAETPSFQRVSLPLVIATALVTAATFAVGVSFAMRAQKTPIRAGQEALLGRSGIVRVDLAPSGQVQLGGELWSAEVTEGQEHIPRGERIVVTGVEGLRLKVRRM